MPDWLKIMFMITSTVIAIIVAVVLIYANKSSNCLLRKHLWNNRKNSKIDLTEFELRAINKPQGIPTSHPLTHRSTANSCHSLAQRQSSQLPTTSCDQSGSPFLYCSSKGKTDVHNEHLLKVKESSKMKMPATPGTVMNFLEDVGLDFHKYDKFKHAKEGFLIPHDLTKYFLIKPSECIL